MLDPGYGQGQQRIRVTNTRQHEQLRRIDGTTTENDLTAGGRKFLLFAAQGICLLVMHTGHPLFICGKFEHSAAGLDLQVGPVFMVGEIGPGRAATSPLINSPVEGAKTFLLSTVQVVTPRVARGLQALVPADKLHLTS